MGGGSGNPLPPPQAAAAAFRVDRPLQALGFEFTRVTAEEVVGRLPVTETCCQVALRLAQRRRVGADGGDDGQHRGLRRVGVPEAGRGAALHQPRRPRAPRRPRPGAGHARPTRPQNPGLGGPDMADRSFHLGEQRSGVNSEGHPIDQSTNTRKDEELRTRPEEIFIQVVELLTKACLPPTLSHTYSGGAPSMSLLHHQL
uniref:Uncharacterized protein n=1 Tax=Zea mays TaxID=4577 RepID=A0A804RIX9_MAIZE